MTIRERILATCFDRYEGTFANGETANNKLDGEKAQYNHVLRPMITRRLAKLVLRHNPDFVVAVPTGANWLARDIAEQHDLALVRLRRDPRNRERMEFYGSGDKEACEAYERGVLLEDVINRFTNTHRALRIPLLRQKIVAEAAIWDRGPKEDREEPGFPYEALIDEPIPALLPADSSLWEYAQS
jgi:hypothetical protein